MAVETDAGQERNHETTIERVRKRSGKLVPFDESKIANAIFKAAQAVGGDDRMLAEELASMVTMMLERNHNGSPPDIEEIQDTVEKVLIETGHARTAKAYILYRDRRARIRQSLQVRKPVRKSGNSTDIALLVNTETQDQLAEWDKTKIANALEVEADLARRTAREIASAVEERVMDSGLTRISTSLIRELVDNELFERGLTARLKKQATVGMPKFDLDHIIHSKSKENANIAQNNPEAINLAVAEHTLKQYALQEVFSDELAEAHMLGKIHIHDLGYPTRVYCSSHSIEYLKKYGLNLQNLDTSSAPAKHARTLTGHLNTFLASMQAYYAGALGVGYINIFYAPFVEGMSYKEMEQEAQHLIFSSSQNAFSRGGQTLFLDFNVHTGVPGYLRDVPAIGPGGEYSGRTYGSYEKTAQRFCKAMLDVWRAGDQHGNVFAFPKCDLHISQDTLDDPAQREILRYAAQIASENGVPYFIFDRDEVTLSACCRLRTTIRDDYMIRHPESMRFCGFQNITINLPQAAYRAGKGNWDGFYQEVDGMIDLAMEAHLQKRRFIASLMTDPSKPLWEIGKQAADGRPYVDLDKATYIIGLIGLNEAMSHLTGRELHEDNGLIRKGLHLVRHMQFRARELGEQHNMRVALEESPAESAARRLAKVDLDRFPEAEEVIRGELDSDEMYYTNSIHLRADAPVDLFTRIRLQSKFHRAIESGAIIHAFVGEERPPAASIQKLVEKTFRNTQAAQLTISPEFTICEDCHQSTPGLKDTCGHCDSPRVYGMTRVVGYFSRIPNWNKSKIGELKDRHKGNYSAALV
ncbi:MAG: anaerobic ribonucleoside-triphosphate reductase [Candidatus Brocadiia bacterium]